MGRAMKNLDKLLAMPYGCGEQNMLLFAPNIFILNYLKSTGQLTPDILEKAKRFLESGEFQTLRLKGIVSVSMQRQGPVPPDGGSAGGRYRLSEGAHLQARRRLVQRLRKQRRVRKHLVGKRGRPLAFLRNRKSSECKSGASVASAFQSFCRPNVFSFNLTLGLMREENRPPRWEAFGTFKIIHFLPENINNCI